MLSVWYLNDLCGVEATLWVLAGLCLMSLAAVSVTSYATMHWVEKVVWQLNEMARVRGMSGVEWKVMGVWESMKVVRWSVLDSNVCCLVALQMKH